MAGHFSFYILDIIIYANVHFFAHKKCLPHIMALRKNLEIVICNNQMKWSGLRAKGHID